MKYLIIVFLFYSRDVRLFYTARNMIELYRVVVPTYYEEDLVLTNFLHAAYILNCSS